MEISLFVGKYDPTFEWNSLSWTWWKLIVSNLLTLSVDSVLLLNIERIKWLLMAVWLHDNTMFQYFILLYSEFNFSLIWLNAKYTYIFFFSVVLNFSTLFIYRLQLVWSLFKRIPSFCFICTFIVVAVLVSWNTRYFRIFYLFCGE